MSLWETLTLYHIMVGKGLNTSEQIDQYVHAPSMLCSLACLEMLLVYIQQCRSAFSIRVQAQIIFDTGALILLWHEYRLLLYYKYVFSKLTCIV